MKKSQLTKLIHGLESAYPDGEMPEDVKALYTKMLDRYDKISEDEDVNKLMQ